MKIIKDDIKEGKKWREDVKKEIKKKNNGC